MYPKLSASSMIIHLLLCVSAIVTSGENGDCLTGLGSYDMPVAQVNMMGHANLEQNTAGIHFRLRARTFNAAESSTGTRFAFVNLDAGMASRLVTIKVLEGLQKRYGNLYNVHKVARSATHMLVQGVICRGCSMRFTL